MNEDVRRGDAWHTHFLDQWISRLFRFVLHAHALKSVFDWFIMLLKAVRFTAKSFDMAEQQPSIILCRAHTNPGY